MRKKTNVSGSDSNAAASGADGGAPALDRQRTDVSDAPLKQGREQKTYFSSDGKWCYQASIIDYLQAFDRSKKNEVMAKRLVKRVDTTKLSARPPDPYGARFMKFMRGTAFELDKAQQKEAQLDVEKMKEELVGQIKKMLAEMIRDAFMKKGGGGDGQGVKISLPNFKDQQAAADAAPEADGATKTGDEVGAYQLNSAGAATAERKAEAPAPAQATALDLEESQISLYSADNVE